MLYDRFLRASLPSISVKRSFVVNTKGGRWYDEVRQPPAYIPAISSFHPSLPLLRALPILFCIAPKGRSPRLFPLRAPLIRFTCFVPRHGYFCCSSRCFFFFSCCVLLPLLLFLFLSSVHRFFLCPSGYARFLFAPRFVPPFSPFSFLPALRFSFQAGPVASFVFVE